MRSGDVLRTVRSVRQVVGVLAIVLAGHWMWADRATAMQEKPCEFMNPNDPDPDFRVCFTDKQHIYAGSCEGIDCYARMETCCGGS